MNLTKRALRNRFQAERDRLTDESYAAKSAAITNRVKLLPEVQDAVTIHIYWPIVYRREVDTRSLIFSLYADEKQIVLPVVSNFSREMNNRPRLSHILFEGMDRIAVNRWGIGEPTGGKTVPLNEIELVIVPAIGAGRNGYRIGFGYGYYDEFLEQLNVPTVCLVYDSCLIDEVPADKHDVPVSIIVTEQEIVRL